MKAALRASGLLALVVAGCAGTADEAPTASKGMVRGLVSFAGGTPLITECGTNRKFTLGPMPQGPYMRFQDRYEQLSKSSKSVLAEFSGIVRPSGDGGTIQEPYLLQIKPRQC